MNITLELPKLFIEIHRNQINVWLDQQPRPTHWRVHMREPLGPPSTASSDQVVSIPTLRADQDGEKLTVKPADASSANLIADWTARHKHTTRDEFDWLPFTTKKARHP